MDRQHPRDLFDVLQLFAHEGITAGIRRAFLVYLASHNRPVHEVLFPSLRDNRQEFEHNFTGMIAEPVELDALLAARERMIRELQDALSADEHRFLLSLVAAEPEWPLLGVPRLEQLPDLRWKLQNLERLRKTNAKKYRRALGRSGSVMNLHLAEIATQVAPHAESQSRSGGGRDLRPDGSGAGRLRRPRQLESRRDCRLGDGQTVQETRQDRRLRRVDAFCLLPRQRLLLEADQPVPLGSRALDILVALIEHHGELVTRRELMLRVWPGITVVDANLSVHIAALRRALRDGHAGSRYLVTTPGQGYRFVAPISTSPDQQPGWSWPPPMEQDVDARTMLTRLIGSADEVMRLASELLQASDLSFSGPTITE